MLEMIQHAQKENAVELTDRLGSQIHNIGFYSFYAGCQISSYELKTLETSMVFPCRFIHCDNPAGAASDSFKAEIAVRRAHVQNGLAVNWIFECGYRFRADHLLAIFRATPTLDSPRPNAIRKDKRMPP